jgi:hypothetical protein
MGGLGVTKSLELSGVRFGRLIVEKPIAGRVRRWLCLCDCGGSATPTTTALTSGKTQSCGCKRVDVGKGRVTHGMTDTSEYRTWAPIIQRCENANSTSYPNYGGRGIEVCKEWCVFENFLKDMGPKPSKHHTIERVDVNEGYCAANCIWTGDKALQAFNQNLKSNNTSGKSGVYWRADRARWIAKIFHKGSARLLGSFKSIDDAIACRISAEISKYGKVKPDGVG